MHSYLKNRKQKVQINNKRNAIVRLPQASINGPLPLFINDLVFFVQHSVLSNCADNNLFVIGKNKKDKFSFIRL